jgi:hypothetical protein
MPQRVATGIAKCCRIRHLTDANAVENDQNYAIKSHLTSEASMLQVLEQIGETIQYGHMIGRTKILSFALPSPRCGI